MHWLIDESKNFILKDTPTLSWDIATVGGVILPYEGRNKWVKKYKWVDKACNFTDESKISTILDDLIECKINGILIVGDLGHVSKLDAEKFRTDWIAPHYAYADSQPQDRGNDLRRHLDNLMGKGQNRLSLQDFLKTLAILEVISYFIQSLTQNLHNTRAIDIRKISLIIDDQSNASVLALREFIHYFLFRRSQEGLYNCVPGSLQLLHRYLRKEDSSTYLNTTLLLDEILVGAGAKMDNKYPILKIADLLANFSRRALNGDFSPNITQKLSKIVKFIPICFDSNNDRTVTIPPNARDSVHMLLGNQK